MRSRYPSAREASAIVYRALRSVPEQAARVSLGEVEGDSPTLPWIVVQPVAPVGDVDTLAGDRWSLDEMVRVTMASTSAATVLALVDDVRAVLSTGRPTSNTFHVEPLRLVRSSGVMTDMDVRVPGVGHPVYAVDVWRLRAQPLV